MNGDNISTISGNGDVVSQIEAAARAELDKELSEEAKRQLKASLRRIADAKKVLANLELEHEALLADLRAGA